MTKTLAVVLGLALGAATASPVSAQPATGSTSSSKRAKKKAPKPAKPVTTPEPAPAATTPVPVPVAPATPPPAAPPAGKAPLATDEKAGENESLQGEATEQWKRGVPQSEQAAALVLFREGNVSLNDGLFVPASEKYRAALKHWNHPAIHYNLALALLNLDQPIEVHDQLNQAIIYGAAPLEKDKFDHAKEYLLLVEKQLADIEVSCDKAGAKVSVDGKEAFIAPGKVTMKVRVGKHVFSADKQGFNARVSAPYIGPGEKYRVELKLYTDPELTRYRRKWERAWVPWVVIGGGALVGLGAVGLELSAQSSYDDFNKRIAACNTMIAGCPTNTPGIAKLRDDGDSKRTMGYVGYGIAGAAIVTGAALLFVNREQSYRITPEEYEAGRGMHPVAVTPVVSPDMTGAMVQGSF